MTPSGILIEPGLLDASAKVEKWLPIGITTKYRSDIFNCVKGKTCSGNDGATVSEPLETIMVGILILPRLTGPNTTLVNGLIDITAATRGSARG